MAKQKNNVTPQKQGGTTTTKQSGQIKESKIPDFQFTPPPPPPKKKSK